MSLSGGESVKHRFASHDRSTRDRGRTTGLRYLPCMEPTPPVSSLGLPRHRHEPRTITFVEGNQLQRTRAGAVQRITPTLRVLRSRRMDCAVRTECPVLARLAGGPLIVAGAEFVRSTEVWDRAVTGLVIDVMRKITSGLIGLVPPAVAVPVALCGRPSPRGIPPGRPWTSPCYACAVTPSVVGPVPARHFTYRPAARNSFRVPRRAHGCDSAARQRGITTEMSRPPAGWLRAVTVARCAAAADRAM